MRSKHIRLHSKTRNKHGRGGLQRLTGRITSHLTIFWINETAKTTWEKEKQYRYIMPFNNSSIFNDTYTSLTRNSIRSTDIPTSNQQVNPNLNLPTKTKNKIKLIRISHSPRTPIQLMQGGNHTFRHKRRRRRLHLASDADAAAGGDSSRPAPSESEAAAIDANP
ncbi:hypothetical protein STAS_03964 [Striga asiatica]|uniref:Uncharacterized protein n=1 Tax=Striga asiatica TaxID=4170 RepID=A0A5A7P6J1_STRAF|nr:hypothetical protein STAS_03964 [Striga asiatica]